MSIKDILNSGLINRATNKTKFNRHERRVAEKQLDLAVAKANIPKGVSIKMESEADARATQNAEAIVQQNIAQVIALRESLGDRVSQFSDSQLLESWAAFAKAKRSDVFVPFLCDMWAKNASTGV